LEASSEFDSELERRFCTRWGNAPRDGWTLHRESVILDQGQKTFVPDFELRHESGRSVLLEVVGFWTSEYVAAKQQTLAAFAGAPIVLLLPSDVPWPESDSARIVRYKSSIRVSDVLAALPQQLSTTCKEDTGRHA
jgi:predicted nuclease of restriction endonuclease-like RecB superfamily